MRAATTPVGGLDAGIYGRSVTFAPESPALPAPFR